MFELNEVFEKLQTLLEKKGAKLYSFEISESEKRELNTEKTDFNLLRTIYDNNAAVSVILSGKKGTAAGNDLTEEGLEKLVDDAMLSAESSMEDDANAIAERQTPETFRTGPWEADMNRFYQALSILLTQAKKDYPQVNILQLIADHTQTHSLYGNSSGTRFEHFDGVYHVTVEMSASDGEKNTGLNYMGLSTYDLDTPLMEQGSIRSHFEEAQKSLLGAQIDGKFEGTVIFTPDCLGEFLYSLESNYMMGSVIMDGTSQWLSRLNEQVASEKVTLTLASKDLRITEAQPYTSDGFKAENVALIEKGVLKNFILDLYASRKTGRPVTKNGGLSAVMEPGETPLKDIIAQVDRGLIVGGFSGGEPGANGEFSGVAKNSFYVEKGRIVGAVTETMINGNIESVFKNVLAVSKEQVWDGYSALPYLACGGIVISGK